MTARDLLAAVLSPDLVAAIEELVDERVRNQLDDVGGADVLPSPWLTIVETAELLRCKRQRIDDLLSQGRLARYKDGSRTLISRADVDAYLRRQGQ